MHEKRNQPYVDNAARNIRHYYRYGLEHIAGHWNDRHRVVLGYLSVLDSSCARYTCHFGLVHCDDDCVQIAGLEVHAPVAQGIERPPPKR